MDSTNSGNPSGTAGQGVPWLTPDWFDRAHKALRRDFGDIPDALRVQMIQWLLDHGFWDRSRLTWDSAQQRWADCLHPGKHQKFGLLEVLALATAFDRTAFASLFPGREEVTDRTLTTAERLSATLSQAAGLAHELIATLGYSPVRDPRMHPRMREAAAPVFDVAPDLDPDDGNRQRVTTQFLQALQCAARETAGGWDTAPERAKKMAQVFAARMHVWAFQVSGPDRWPESRL